MIVLRDYQKEISQKAHDKLLSLGMVYLSMEVRTGKTLTALNTCKLYHKGWANFKVLIITKKKAIKDIEQQCKDFNFKATVINYESVNKVDSSNLDIIILDEAHSIGAYPKPTNRFKDIKEILKNSNRYTRIIFLSGTPSPESYSQLYHQFAVSNEFNPFKDYVNFYKWANDYVDKQEKRVANGFIATDYSNAYKDKIDKILNPYFISYSQNEAGFNQRVNEEILIVEMKPITYQLTKKLIKDDIVEGNNNVILADTAVKKQSKLHQLFSGTIKFEDGSTQTIDKTKAEFIRDKFKGKKIAIFYIFKQEFELLKEVFSNFTLEPTEFNEYNDLVFLGQIRSVREGLNLSSADCLIMYNIDFSAISYLQGKDRMTSKNRTKENKVYWIFSKGGIESKIYKAVVNKKDYTLSYFKQDYENGKPSTKQDNKGFGGQGLLFN